jgi:hypothetical protein
LLEKSQTFNSSQTSLGSHPSINRLQPASKKQPSRRNSNESQKANGNKTFSTFIHSNTNDEFILKPFDSGHFAHINYAYDFTSGSQVSMPFTTTCANYFYNATLLNEEESEESRNKEDNQLIVQKNQQRNIRRESSQHLPPTFEKQLARNLNNFNSQQCQLSISAVSNSYYDSSSFENASNANKSTSLTTLSIGTATNQGVQLKPNQQSYFLNDLNSNAAHPVKIMNVQTKLNVENLSGHNNNNNNYNNRQMASALDQPLKDEDAWLPILNIVEEQVSLTFANSHIH